MKRIQKGKLSSEYQNTADNIAINLRKPEKLIIKAEENTRAKASCNDCVDEIKSAFKNCTKAKNRNKCIIESVSDECADCLCDILDINCSNKEKMTYNIKAQVRKLIDERENGLEGACSDCLVETFDAALECLIIKFGNIFEMIACIFDFIEEDCLHCICSLVGFNCPENMKDAIHFLGQSLKNQSFYVTKNEDSCSNFDTDNIVEKCRNTEDFEQCFIDEIENLSDDCATCFCEKLGIDCCVDLKKDYSNSKYCICQTFGVDCGNSKQDDDYSMKSNLL